jgi:hypothetical protein
MLDVPMSLTTVSMCVDLGGKYLPGGLCQVMRPSVKLNAKATPIESLRGRLRAHVHGSVIAGEMAVRAGGGLAKKKRCEGVEDAMSERTSR